MGLYFCPKCGQDYDKVDCIDDGLSLRCPHCLTKRVIMTGRAYVVFGLLIAFVSAFITRPYVLIGGAMIGAALFVTGVVRMAIQRRAKRTHRFTDSDIDDL